MWIYLNDASRCVTGFGLFSGATSENAVATLQLAIRRFGTPAIILYNNGRCFVTPKHKLPTKKWQPTLFENELLERGIGLINSRPYHPQTNGMLERFNQIKSIIMMACLNTLNIMKQDCTFHLILIMNLRAFYNKKATKAIREENP